jgi:hypothetical protein
MHKIKFMKHKKLSSMHYLTVNISGLDEGSLENGALDCKTFSETTSIVAVSVDAANENGGQGGWHIGGADGCPACESTEDACNGTDVEGGL